LIREMDVQVISSVDSLRPLADFYLCIDNSVDQRAPVLVASSLGNGPPHLDDVRGVWQDATLLNNSYVGAVTTSN
jgi:hypothetical protein